MFMILKHIVAVVMLMAIVASTTMAGCPCAKAKRAARKAHRNSVKASFYMGRGYGYSVMRGVHVTYRSRSGPCPAGGCP